MKATWNGAVLAEAAQEDLIHIEGNWYFPPDAVHK
ncbi:TPA: nucleotidyltransferase domain-containing protein, partial [Candidatus Saccharibacteria bacterium]|nr:nucleotidyltransferase domain-containing protein [Candidatus Saccharibacteria bacterium]